MAFKDVKNTVYNQLIALAEKQKIRQATIGSHIVYFTNQESAEELQKLGIKTAPVGQAVLTQLSRDKIYDTSEYPLTFTAKAVGAAITKASPKDSANYLLTASVGVNTPDLPYTPETQQDVNARKMMLR